MTKMHEPYNDLRARTLRPELGAGVRRNRLARVLLTPRQNDLIAQACMVAVDESARFLHKNVRRSVAKALRAMGKPQEAEWIENGTPINDKAG